LAVTDLRAGDPPPSLNALGFRQNLLALGLGQAAYGVLATNLLGEFCISAFYNIIKHMLYLKRL